MQTKMIFLFSKILDYIYNIIDMSRLDEKEFREQCINGGEYIQEEYFDITKAFIKTPISQLPIECYSRTNPLNAG